MFYSRDILLSKKYGLSIVWLAATLGNKAYYKKITKRDLIGVNITIACNFIERPPEPLALRFTSNLLYGIIKIYNRQVQYCYNDAIHMISQIKNELLNGNNFSTLLQISEARHDAITLNEREFLNFDDQLPLTLTNTNDESQTTATTLIEFGWIKNYDKQHLVTNNETTKKNKAKKNNISIPEISINITDLHERSFNNDQYYDLLLSQEGLLQESLNIFNNDFLDTGNISSMNVPRKEKPNDDKNQIMDIALPDDQNVKNTEQYDKELYDYLQQNPELFNEIKEIIREEHSLDNIQLNSTEKGEQIMKTLNILDPHDFSYEQTTKGIINQSRKRKGNKFFDEEISLPGNYRYYSDDNFDYLYDKTHQQKKIRLLSNKFRKSIFNDRSKITAYNEYHQKIRSYYSSQHISPNDHFDSNRYLYNTSLQFLKQTLQSNNDNTIDKYASIENLRNPFSSSDEDTHSRLLFSREMLRELQQQQENRKNLTNSFSFNDLNLNFDHQEWNSKLNYNNNNIDNPLFTDLIFPEDLTNVKQVEEQKNPFHDQNEFLFNLDQEPEIFRGDKIQNQNDNDIPLLQENSLEENLLGHSKRSNFPWNVTSYTTPDRNTNNRISSRNNSSRSTRSSVISISSSNLETPTKKRRISFGKNIEISPISDDSSYQRHNRSIFDNSNENIIPFPTATKINSLLVGKEDTLRFYNYILDIVEISNNSLFPDEIQKGNDENNPPSIFFSDLIPSKTSIDINKKKLSRSSDKDDISDSDSDFLTSSFHPASSDMAVEAFYHVLVLSTNGLIKPIQRQSYGDIKLEMTNIKI